MWPLEPTWRILSHKATKEHWVLRNLIIRIAFTPNPSSFPRIIPCHTTPWWWAIPTSPALSFRHLNGLQTLRWLRRYRWRSTKRRMQHFMFQQFTLQCLRGRRWRLGSPSRHWRWSSRASAYPYRVLGTLPVPVFGCLCLGGEKVIVSCDFTCGQATRKWSQVTRKISFAPPHLLSQRQLEHRSNTQTETTIWSEIYTRK